MTDRRESLDSAASDSTMDSVVSEDRDNTENAITGVQNSIASSIAGTSLSSVADEHLPKSFLNNQVRTSNLSFFFFF
jgi:hypothetical protein